MVEEIINIVGIPVSVSLKEKETPYGKQLLHKDESCVELKGQRYACYIIFRDRHGHKYQ